MSDSSANRSLAARLTRFLGGVFGGEPNHASRSTLHDELDELIAGMSSLTDDDVLLLTDFWQREDRDVRRQAWTKSQAALKDSANAEALDKLRQTVGEWTQARPSDFQGLQGLMGSAGMSATARQAAAPAIIDRAVAILGRDRLDEAGYMALSRPWNALVDAIRRT